MNAKAFPYNPSQNIVSKKEIYKIEFKQLKIQL